MTPTRPASRWDRRAELDRSYHAGCNEPAGRILELGTGTGMATAWLLAGMDASSKLDSVDRDPAVQEIAKRHLGYDNRVTFHLGEGTEFALLSKFILNTMPRTAAASMTRDDACSVYKATPNCNTTQRTDRRAGFTDS